jgi:hypothetical protein
MSCSEKVNISLMRGTRKLQMICYSSFLKMSNAKQVRKESLQSLIPTPNVMPESNFGAIPHFKSNVARKLPSAFLIVDILVFMLGIL